MIEVATIAVIVGMVLGLAFKGRDLMDSARVKSTQASAIKIQSAIALYHERYGRYPGDGCTGSTPTTEATCKGARDGLLNTASERIAFWQQLSPVAGVLSPADRNTPLGVQWNVVSKGSNLGAADSSAWIVAGNDGSQPTVDIRYVCAIDNEFDDGEPDTGNIRSSAAHGAGSGQYQQNDRCWSKGKTDLQTLAIRILP